jgi:riboflavin biosynthesis pyrimidine reductase
MHLYCAEMNWTLFRMTIIDDHRLHIHPVLSGDNTDIMDEFHSSLSPDGTLWIPLPLRELLSLGEQSVMMRVENGAISIYLRKVFETLGFRP